MADIGHKIAAHFFDLGQMGDIFEMQDNAKLCFGQGRDAYDKPLGPCGAGLDEFRLG